MKIVNFLTRIGTVKHKFKVEFAIDTLTMSGTVSEDINVIIKRGSQKMSSSAGRLRKGKLDFKKERLIFEEVTLFYNTSSNEYLSKEAEVRVVITGEEGKRKLAGIIQLDLADYVNQKLQFKREEKELTKCPEKLQSKLSYEIYIKFLRQSNSETPGSVIGGLEANKSKKDKEKDKNKQKEKEKQDKPKRKEKQQTTTRGNKKQDQQRKSSDSQNHYKKPKPNKQQTVVHFDKQRQINIKESEYPFVDQKPISDNHEFYHNEVVFEEYERPNTEHKEDEQIPPPQLPQIQVSHQDTQHHQQMMKKLQKQTERLSQENQELERKAMSLKQRLSQNEQERAAMIEEQNRNTTYDNLGKYDIRIRQLQTKIEGAKKTKRQNERNFSELNQKYIQLKNQIDGERVNASYDLNAIETQYKTQLEKDKEELKKVKTAVQKLEKQHKGLSKQMSELRRQEELKQLMRKQAEGKITEIELEVNKLKMRVCEAMNKAADADDNELSQFLVEYFSN